MSYCIVLKYRKHRNIGGTFNLVIEHKITKLKTIKILAHSHNIIDTGRATAILKIHKYFIIASFFTISPNFLHANISMFMVA